MIPVLESKNLTIGYDKKPLAQGLSLQLFSGELVCLLGPNGAGKTTLLKTLTGLKEPLSGEVLLKGHPLNSIHLTKRAKQIALVLTKRLQTSFMTVQDFIALGRHPYTGFMGQLSEQDWEEVQLALTQVQMTEYAEKKVSQLSDGQGQRVMIARALSQKPDLLVLDEPTAFLDLPNRLSLMTLLKELAREQNQALLLSTHELDLALKSADRLWLMGENDVFYQGSPEDLGLQGKLKTIFGLDWNPSQGAFIETHNFIGSIKLNLPQDKASWAERAIQRAGWQVSSQATNLLEWSESGWRVNSKVGPDLAWVVAQLKANSL